MSIIDNLRLMVRHYPGGINSLAPRLNKAVSTLEKELRGAEGFKLGALDAESISQMCIEASSDHCRAYINSLAVQSGRFIELPADVEPPKNLQGNFADVVKEASDLLSCGISALSDNVISDNEQKQLSVELAELMGQIQSVMRGVNSLYAAGKKAQP